MNDGTRQWKSEGGVPGIQGGLRPRRLFASLTVAVIVVTAVGCGKPATIVTGAVTLDGRPLGSAFVEFRPVAGDGQTSATTTDAGGRYRANVSPVPLIVAIRKSEAIDKRPATSGEEATTIVAEIVPPRYSNPSKSELRVTPLEGKTTQADFALASGNK